MAQLKLPHEWLQIHLGDVVSYGKTQKCELSDVTNDTWVLELEDVEKESSRIISRKTAKERPFKSTKNRFDKGNVLYGKLRPYLNKVVVADTNGVCTTEIVPLDSEPFVLNRYMFHWLRTRDFLNYVNAVSYGVNMPRLGTKDGVAAPFVLAPLAEQKVIADKLDTLLAQVENTKARLELIPHLLKRFRQSVLAAAVSGRLTEEWRNRACLPAWEVTVVDNVIGNIDQGWSPKCHNEPTTDESWAIIKTSSVLPMTFAENENKKLPESLDVKPNLRVLPNDILTTRAGPRSRCGITCYVSSTSRNLMICDKVYRYRVIEGKGSSKFLALQLNSPSVLEKIETLKTGISESGMNLTQKKFRQLDLKWPTPEEQAEIVRRVDQLFAHADRIEQQVNNALTRINKLTQSILAKAFRGELTEQWRNDNPDLISGENSAKALLERIKTERAKQQPARRRTKTRKTETPAT
ncbi:type I restriction enzyme, S subunit [Marinobacter sp. DSM 26671]|uniref:restriction endonuclease subunit S n=1 Tax=Marinobacter sp. DSM 26671 TaxID=1761793 RepID=UPI0008E93C65|nr:restriction endonuclease subunit S [Marinobacter sp. DSM 26671]SFE55171.1 type I restriction enzyme, S subunit [Marinobacter sp. DSM 26671]